MWEKKLICQKREEVKYAKEKLCDFGRHFVDDQGLPVPVSTLSDILKEKDKWISYVSPPAKALVSCVLNLKAWSVQLYLDIY